MLAEGPLNACIVIRRLGQQLLQRRKFPVPELPASDAYASSQVNMVFRASGTWGGGK